MPLDRDRLIKIMGLTTSDQDGEALSALRKANEMLAAEKVTWAEVLQAHKQTTINISAPRAGPQSFHQSTDDWIAPHLKDKVTIDLMFRAIYQQPRTGNEDFWQWLDSVHNDFNKKTFLTPGQYEAVRKCYGRALRAGSMYNRG